MNINFLRFRIGIICKILFLLVIHPSVLFCQSVSITGLISDCANDVSLPSASVVLYDASDQTLIGYSISKSDGNYTLSFDVNFEEKRHRNYQLVTSYIGYRSDTLFVKLDSLPSTLNVCLKKDLTLQTIDVTATRYGVEIIGDTTKYNVGVYKRDSDSNLKDVVSRLPGLSVDDEGEIKYGTQKITEVQVNGDNFMNTSRTALLNGLSAKNIENIKLFRDAETDGFIMNVETGSERTFNLSSENFVGFGKNTRYLSNNYAYIFYPKVKLFYSGRTNNTGTKLISFGDYIRQTGNVFSSNSLNDLGRVPKYVFDKPETYAKYRGLSQSLNWSFDASRDFKLSGFYSYFSSHRESVFSSSEILLNRTFEINQVENTYSNTKSHRLGLRGLYNLSKVKIRFGTTITTSNNLHENSSSILIDADDLFAQENRKIKNDELNTYVNGTYENNSISIVVGASHQINNLGEDKRLFSSDTLVASEVIGFASTNLNQTEYRPFQRSSFVIRTEKKFKNKLKLENKVDLTINTWRDEYNIGISNEQLMSVNQYIGTIGSYESGISKKYDKYKLYAGLRAIKPFDNQPVRLFPSAKVEIKSSNRKRRLEFLLNGNSEFSNFLLSNLDTFHIIEGLYEIIKPIQSDQKTLSTYNAQLVYADLRPLRGRATFLYSRFFTGDIETFSYSSNDLLTLKSPAVVGKNNSFVLGFIYDKKSITKPFSITANGLVDISNRKLLRNNIISPYTQRLMIINGKLNYFFSDEIELFSESSIQNSHTKASESNVNFSVANFLIGGKLQTNRLGLTIEFGAVLSDQNRTQNIVNAVLNFDALINLKKFKIAVKGINILNIKEYSEFHTTFRDEIITESTRTLLPGAMMLGIQFSFK